MHLNRLALGRAQCDQKLLSATPKHDWFSALSSYNSMVPQFDMLLCSCVYGLQKYSHLNYSCPIMLPL